MSCKQILTNFDNFLIIHSVHWVCRRISQLQPMFFKLFSFWKESGMSCMYISTCSYKKITAFCPAHTRICQITSFFFYIPWLFLMAWMCWKCYSSLQNVYKKNMSGVNYFHSYTDYCTQGQVWWAVAPPQTKLNKKTFCTHDDIKVLSNLHLSLNQLLTRT
jgi:hypothetical protein